MRFAKAFLLTLYVALGFFELTAAAQTAAQPSVYAIKGAKIHTLAGPVIDNGIVVIRDGKIAAVGVSVSIPSDAQVIDAVGMELYPGLFDPITQIGLEEIAQVSATLPVKPPLGVTVMVDVPLCPGAAMLIAASAGASPIA